MTRGFTIWLTGLSGAGKTTIAERLDAELRRRGRRVELLDGDVVRTHLSKGLGFSKEDRDTNIRRIGFVAKLLTRNGAAVIASAISPYREIRDENRRDIGDFVEVYVECPLEELVKRDVKGLYAKAIRGEIAQFTGVSDPYEEPLNAEVVVRTDRETVEESTAKILAKLEDLGYIPPAAGGNGAGPAKAEAWQSIAPHGGRLIDRRVADVREWEERARGLKQLRLSAREASDLHMIAVGGFSPLEGFMTRDDYLGAVKEAHLASGLVWPAPITLSASQDVASGLREGEDVALLDESGQLLAVLHLADIFPYDKELEAKEVYRTTDVAHPGVASPTARETCSWAAR
ncbi:MAG: adenylyl-sulfate kinase [Chloroflexi bacterium]|nr:adenylyl-sulfate kinase [Chloroflexota bacterium]